MVDIDFNRLINNAKDEFEVAKLFFMPEKKRHKYYQERIGEAEKRFYEDGGRYNSSRQLYMAKLISTPLVKNGLMPYLQKVTELGNGYQPNVNVPFVFVPQYNDHIDVYYKGHRLFDFEIRDEFGNQNESSGIKSISIADRKSIDILARIPNEEWNDVVDKVIPEILSDSKLDEMTLMMKKTDTEYIQRLHVHLNKQLDNKPLSVQESFSEKPNAINNIQGMSDEDLQQMYEAMLQGKALESDAIDHQYGD